MADLLHSIAALAADAAMQLRVAAGIAQAHETGFPVPPQEVAEGEAYRKRFAWAASPTWGEKYQYALDNGNTNPGGDPSVIPDLDIIAWVQNEYPKPPPVEIDNTLPETPEE